MMRGDGRGPGGAGGVTLRPPGVREKEGAVGGRGVDPGRREEGAGAGGDRGGEGRDAGGKERGDGERREEGKGAEDGRDGGAAKPELQEEEALRKTEATLVEYLR